MEALFSECLVHLWYCSGLCLRFSSPGAKETTALKLDGTYLINGIDETLSLFAPKIPRGSDTGRGMHEGVDDRDGLGGRDLCHMGVIIGCGRIGSLQEDNSP